jgi:hypothetical protein
MTRCCFEASERRRRVALLRLTTDQWKRLCVCVGGFELSGTRLIDEVKNVCGQVKTDWSEVVLSVRELGRCAGLGLGLSATDECNASISI